MATTKPQVGNGKPAIAPGKPQVGNGKPAVAPGKPAVAPGKPAVAPGKPKVAGSKPKVTATKPGVAAVKPKPAATKSSTADKPGPTDAPSRPTAVKKNDKPASNGDGSGDEDVEGFVDVNAAGVRAQPRLSMCGTCQKTQSIYRLLNPPLPLSNLQHKWAPRDVLEAPVNEEDARKRLQELTFDFSFG